MTPGKTQPVAMLDFSRQYVTIKEEVLAAIDQVCSSQKFILGPEVGTFERHAAEACDAAYGIGCGSGTDALWLAMAGAGVGPGDFVITTPFSFFATASAILRCGAIPLFADIDERTFNLSPESVVGAIRRHAGKPIKAVLPVHLYGQCADWDALTVIKAEHGVRLIEDAAQAFGATWKSAPAGALGDAAAFSFYPTKNLSAFGDAGLVTTSDPSIDDRARLLRAHGMRQRYIHEEVGWNSRLDSIQAAVLNVKLRYLAAWNTARRQRASVYDRLFMAAGLVSKASGIAPRTAVILPTTDPRAGHVFHQYVIRAPRRDELRQFLAERSIGTEIYYPIPLHMQTSLAHLGYKPGNFPVTERAAAEVLALPMYPELREDEQETVVAAIAEFYS